MKPFRYQFQIVLRLTIIILSFVLSILFAFKNYWYSFTFVLIVSLIAIFEFVFFIKLYFNQDQKIVQALLQNDFSLNTATNTCHKNIPLAQLYTKIKKEHFENNSKEILYQQLLNAVPSGFLVLKETSDDRQIVFMNQYFKDLFDLPTSSSWSYLQKFIPQFCDTLTKSNFANQKTTIDIQINNEEKQTYILQNSKTILAQETYDVIFLDSIQRVIDATEKEAWMNIMKVIAHEIINSLTPIHSLAHSTKMYLEDDVLDKESIEDVRLSLDTIMSRSQHLHAFIEQYRQLTMLPTPVKSVHNLKEVIVGVKKNFQSSFKSKNITFYDEVPDHFSINIDLIQFEQVLINLIKNAIYSVENTAIKEISIIAKQTENRLQITIQDSGKPIDKEILSKIFLPFYTTRKDGAGIGLTLSKNIIEAHNGYLYYHQNETLKQFVIVLIR